ncbi:hypothetical protein SAY87_031218 [Trapa incisa]|uniref:Rhamnogalacturonase A/B/Epimerase-like pectate lyase domain-containing protein n=1 Tax=Trapa incisa TaxID=236973 RepID=A0AAN7QL69_9MYRT|nr:hypothetical protein SAY87_031218 [Trapa incisa]
MESPQSGRTWRTQGLGMALLNMTIVLLLVSPWRTEGRMEKKNSQNIKYRAISCRAHTASLADFGAVGDGTTSNTAAFQKAINHLSQFTDNGGAQLFVPPGRWLTGSFNLTSHFTLFLHRDAVVLASQVCFPSLILLKI